MKILNRSRTIRVLLGLAGTAFLAVALIHAGVLPIGTPHSAWIPEGIIAVVLFAAVASTWAFPSYTRGVAVAAQGFALALTVIGTYVTVIGIGPTNPWDLPFHFAMLIVLFSGIIVAAHRPRTPARLITMASVQWLIRATGLLQVALGLAFWTGTLLVAIPFHMFNGVLFVLLLAVQAAVAAFSGAPRWLAAATAASAVVVVAVGLTQTQILPGEWHWIVRLAHLAIGLTAMVLTERLTRAAAWAEGNGRWSRVPPRVIEATHLVAAPAGLHVAPAPTAVAAPVEEEPAAARAFLDRRMIRSEEEMTGGIRDRVEDIGSRLGP